MDKNQIKNQVYNLFNRFGFTTHRYPNAIGLWPGDIDTLFWSCMETPKNTNWLEIGSFCGGSATLMCLVKKVTQDNGLVISVDRRPEKIFLDNLSHFEDISVLIKTPSQNFPTFWNGDKLGLAFIDGWHSFKGCLEDFLMLKPYLTKGAIICIHDTATPDNWTEQFIEDKYKRAKEMYDEWMKEVLPNPNTNEQTYNLDEVIAFMIKEHNCEYLKTDVTDPKTYMIPLRYNG